MRLGDSVAVVGDRAEAERDDHGVEALVLELERLRVADPQVDITPEVLGALLGDLQHLQAELDSSR